MSQKQFRQAPKLLQQRLHGGARGVQGFDTIDYVNP